MKRLYRRWVGIVLIAAVAIALAPAAVLLVLRFVDPPATAFMTYTQARLREDNPDAEIAYRWVDIDHMAACMPLAAVASEDQTFPTNHGFAWESIERALRHNANGGRVRGASTITQQTAKNLFLWPAKSYVRKGIEAYITLWMDVLWPKRRVLEVYLNVAQFSPTAFGVSAAADNLFGRRAANLSQSQCAALAAVLPNPKRYDAAHPDSYVAGRQQWILTQMRHLGPSYLDSVLQ
ncbi:monofunctional biosynthetic peptidoglycan transglycosylase [Salinisphaera sp. Q1T1-3]|uniref:monofunctional biosynthetic peptidoglycan transglycosylase n=1 Tax=Salinisphaera sp. Q1T1-3 TaxID=2321229 RepID=UPI000E74FB9D|nr:monofunctional biosynthetic peptidoglycan transglycosylase [Salinisphaera sp. Q1T1-3]RJS91874.1 monofunctional biosynthetic peptidoglycan transglycosylase [Salinisphaera sp. Q1T1-3]